MSSSARGEPALAYLGLGSNLGDRVATIHEALRQLDAHEAIAVLRTSRLYETEPVGPVAQGRFVNAVTELRTTLDPRALLGVAQAVEARLGRRRGERWGPRTIDIDLLLLGEAVIAEPDLIVPHPEMTRRLFVLTPLCELIPEARHPTNGRRMIALREALGAPEGVKALPDPPRDPRR